MYSFIPSEVPSSPVWHDGAGASGGRTSQRRQPRVVDYTEDFDPDNPRGMWVTSSGNSKTIGTTYILYVRMYVCTCIYALHKNYLVQYCAVHACRCNGVPG